MPPDVDENLASVQEIQTAIEPLNNGVRIPVTHHLNDVDDNPLTPDEVIVEVMSYPDESPSNPCNIVGHTRIPSSPEDGTFELELRASDANLSGQNWDITVRVTCLYHHSVQSDDHVAELTAEAGVQINDCTPEPPEEVEVFGAGSVPYSPDGVAWSELFTPLPPPYTGQEANFESVHVQSPAAGTCWTCGAYLLETGMVAYWDGMSWIIWTNAEEPIIFSPQTGIHGWDANNAFCVGAFGSPDCMQWTGGPNWIDHSGVVDPTFNTQYLCVWGMGPTDVWIAGSENGVGAVVSHWNGAVWDVVKAPMPGTVNGEGITGIWGVDANNVWVCVSGVGYGKIWYWNGAVWADVTPGGFMVTNPQDIHGVDANNMWISGSAGQLMHFDGTVGTDVSDVIFAAMTLSGVFAYATDDIWMSSQFNQKIFHWDGAIWTDVPHGVISPNFAAWNYISGVW